MTPVSMGCASLFHQTHVNPSGTYLFHDGKPANVTGVVTFSTDGMTIGKKEDVIPVGADLILALGATETFHVPEFGPVEKVNEQAISFVRSRRDS